MKKLPLTLILCFFLLASYLHAELRLPRLFQDGMVLQRGEHTQIWGWGDSGETVEVNFLGQRYETTVDADGNWSISFAKLIAGGPYELSIKANTFSKSLKDIYIGDVWVCSGQSNMELPMERVKYRFPEVIANSENALIRHFEVPDRYNFKGPMSDLEGGQWLSASPETVLKFTAVGYFFAKEIQSAESVPIGLLNASLGGSPVQSWMSEDALQAFPDELAEAKRWADDEFIEITVAEEREQQGKWYADLQSIDPGTEGSEYIWANPETDTSDWTEMKLPGLFEQNGIKAGPGVIWLKKEFELTKDQLLSGDGRLWLGRIVDADKVFINGTFIGEVTYQYPPRIYDVPADLLHAGRNILMVRVVVNGDSGRFFNDKPYYLELGEEKVSMEGEWLGHRAYIDRKTPGTTFIRWKPVGLFNGLIAPLTPFAIKGAIWYQGESNVGRNPELYQEMFESMVSDWRAKWVGGEAFPFIAVQLANLGEPAENSEPRDDNWAVVREEQYAASKLKNSGIALTYDVGEYNDIHPLDKETVGKRLALCARAIAYGDDGVIYQGPEYAEHESRKGKLIVRFSNVANGLKTREDATVDGFAIAGEDGVFHWAEGKIEGDSVILWAETVSSPIHVRYAWAMNPSNANLYNSANLPAVPFRTDK